MNIRTNRKPLMTLENVAMTDIVLNMFIFFFISFSLLYTFNSQRLSKMDVKLPKATNVEALAESNLLKVIITKKGQLSLNGKAMNIEELKLSLDKGVKNNPDIPVMVISDELAPFKYIVEILDTLTGLGVTRLSIAANKEKG